MASYRAALAIQQRFADANPDDTRLQGNVGLIHGRIASLLYRTGRPAEAKDSYKVALAIEQKLADANSDDTRRRVAWQLATTT